MRSDAPPLQALSQGPSSWRAPPGPCTWTDRAGWVGLKRHRPDVLEPLCSPPADPSAAQLPAASSCPSGLLQLQNIERLRIWSTDQIGCVLLKVASFLSVEPLDWNVCYRLLLQLALLECKTAGCYSATGSAAFAPVAQLVTAHNSSTCPLQTSRLSVNISKILRHRTNYFPFVNQCTMQGFPIMSPLTGALCISSTYPGHNSLVSPL